MLFNKTWKHTQIRCVSFFYNLLILSFFYYFCKNLSYMKYIGNIITKNKLEVSEFFNVTEDFSKVDIKIPTLIIGWAKVKELFPDQDILNSKIDENVYWTFSKREKRYKYEQDIEAFMSNTIQKIEDNVNYKFFNYLTAAPEKRKGFVDFVNRGGCYMYHNSRFLYVYNPNSKMTIGISLMDLRYAGVKIKSFISMLNIDGNNFITNSLDFIDENSFILLKDNIKVAAYLNYLKNSSIY